MNKTMKRYLRIAAFMLCCLMVVVGVEAQYAAREAAQSYEKLGLTPDQKMEIEAVKEDVENQREAVYNNLKLSRDERVAKLREIREGERARLNEILTPAQQRKLKDIMYPKEQWRVDAYFTTGASPAHYTVHLGGRPSEYLSYTIHKRDIKLSVLDPNGKSVPGGPQLVLAPSVPDVIRPVMDDMDGGVCRVEFILDRKTAKPGLYTLIFRAAVDATDAETQESVNIQDAVASQRVYLTPQPDQDPALRPGQRFIGTPWEEVSASTVTPYRDVKSGKPITWREIATKIATLQRVEPNQDGNKLTFVLEGHTGQIFIETKEQVTGLPYLTPLLTEPVVRNLKAQYEGKQVWCYGGPGARCVSTEPGMSIGLSGRVDVPLRIRRVERIYLPKVEMGIGNATFIGGERQSAFVTYNPLLVILDAPAKGLEFSGLMYVGGKDIEEMSIDVVSNPRAHCLGLWNMVSDRWDFEREYSLTDPFKSHPTWPAKMRKAVLNGEVVKGMTHEMVAWTMGWPSMYGTKAEMLRIDDWAYDNIPFQGHIYFKKGRMTSQHWPRLP